MTGESKRTELTAADQIHLGHLVDDHAATYYGGPLNMSLSDAVRYTAEAVVERAFPDVDRAALWALVRAELEAHPEILERGRLTDDQRAARAAERAARSQIHDQAALIALRAGDFDGALRSIDAAEMACPRRPGPYDWDGLRAFVRQARAEAEAAVRELANRASA